MNKEQYFTVEEYGDLFPYLIHSSVKFGENVTLGLGVKIAANVVIGNNVFIGHDTFIRHSSVIHDGVGIRFNCLVDPDCEIGARTQIYPKAIVGGGTKMGEDIYYGPFSLTTNSSMPGVIKPPVIEDRATIYAGCMIGPGVTIGYKAVLGMGSVLTKDIPHGEVWFGNPATVQQQNPVVVPIEKASWPYSERDFSKE